MVARGTVRHLRSSSKAPAASVALTGSRGALAAVVIVIVRNCSCDTTAAAMVQHCGLAAAAAPAPSVALAGSRGALVAMDRR